MGRRRTNTSGRRRQQQQHQQQRSRSRTAPQRCQPKRRQRQKQRWRQMWLGRSKATTRQQRQRQRWMQRQKCGRSCKPPTTPTLPYPLCSPLLHQFFPSCLPAQTEFPVVACAVTPEWFTGTEPPLGDLAEARGGWGCRCAGAVSSCSGAAKGSRDINQSMGAYIHSIIGLGLGTLAGGVIAAAAPRWCFFPSARLLQVCLAGSAVQRAVEDASVGLLPIVVTG